MLSLMWPTCLLKEAPYKQSLNNVPPGLVLATAIVSSVKQQPHKNSGGNTFLQAVFSSSR